MAVFESGLTLLDGWTRRRMIAEGRLDVSIWHFTRFVLVPLQRPLFHFLPQVRPIKMHVFVRGLHLLVPQNLS